MKTVAQDKMSRVTALRPSDRELDAEWSAERREAVWGRIADEVVADRDGAATPRRTAALARGHAPSSRRTPRRRTVWIAAVAAAVAALLAVPLLVPSGGPAGPQSAAALEALADAAAAQEPIGPDQYVHMVYEQKTNGRVTGMETWTATDGKVWHKDTAEGTAMYYTVVPAKGAVDYPSLAFLAGLPTDPEALGRYLRSHAHGSNSQDEAVFVTIGDWLRNGLPLPALRAAALRVLEDTPHVTAISGTDPLGRPATVVTFDDQSIRRGVTQSLYFDPKTADFLGNQLTAPDHDATETVMSSGVVDAIPAQVHRYADHYTDAGTCVTDRGVQPNNVCMHLRYPDDHTTSGDGQVTHITPPAPTN